MRIGDLINTLLNIQDEHGDIEVFTSYETEEFGLLNTKDIPFHPNDLDVRKFYCLEWTMEYYDQITNEVLNEKVIETFDVGVNDKITDKDAFNIRLGIMIK